MKKSGARVELLSIPAGESSKHRQMKSMLEDQLLARGAQRDSVIIALGGGMVGDLAGFTAATLLRGIRYVHIPTTLLSQVDSSVGGKVAVDHPLGKNLVGAFAQPKKVYIDVSTLSTLSPREFSSGMAEVVKYGAILDRKLFSYLEDNSAAILRRRRSALELIVDRSCVLKRRVVELDERETGPRRILNFGHTIGHAVELLSKFAISHGEAVSIGMVAEATMSKALGLCHERDIRRLVHVLQQFSLPTSFPSRMRFETVLAATAHDKKSHMGTIDYTLLDRIGKARVGVPLTQLDAVRLLKP